MALLYKPRSPSCSFACYRFCSLNPCHVCEAFEYLRAQNPKRTTAQDRALQERAFYGKEKKSLAYVIATMNMILHGIEAPNIIHTNTLAENLADVQEKDRFDIIIANPPFGGKERKEVQQNFPVRTGETAFLFLQHFIKVLKAGGRAGIDLTLFGEHLTSSQVGEIAGALDDLLLPYTIDLSLYAELNHAKLREHIDRVGLVFYERASAGQHPEAQAHNPKGHALKQGWETKRLGDILQLEYGKPLDQSDRKPNGRYPVYGANGEKDRTDKFYHDKPSISVGRKGSAGEINLTEKRFWPLDVTYFVTFDKRQHDLRFLYHLLTTLELTKLAKGVKPGINRNEVYSQVVQVPPSPNSAASSP